MDLSDSDLDILVVEEDDSATGGTKTDHNRFLADMQRSALRKMELGAGARQKIPDIRGRARNHAGYTGRRGRRSTSLGQPEGIIRHTDKEDEERNTNNHARASSATRKTGAMRGRGRGGSNSNQGERRSAHLGFRRLQKYAEEDSISGREIALNLISKTSGFSELLSSKSIKQDWIKLLLKVITKACRTSVKEYTIEILSLVVQSQFLLQHVSQSFLMTMLRQKDPVSQLELSQAIENILTILDEIIVGMPSSVNSCEVVLVILETAPEKLEYLTEDERLLLRKRVQSLLQRVNDVQSTKIEELTPRQRKEARRQRLVENPYEALPPPNDFREMSVCPTFEDIHTHEMPYLRANKKTGEYDDISHYLDVQFRLLREDYVRPLREGIAEYLQRQQETGKRGAKFENMRLYQNVRVICPVCTPDGIVCRIQFDTSRLKKVRWQVSKRLLYGSLVCLSPDDFQTLIFATVNGRDVKNLSDGFLDIDFVDGYDPDDETFRQTFFMVETTAYFEAYKHVLAGLHEVQDEMPFQRYVVSCQPDVRAPQYLLNKPEQKYDLSCFLKEKTTAGDKSLARSVPVLNTERWPSLNSVCFDNSQMLAVQTALTKEFAIIQGPPGTGKTFVGLKIVRALLANKAWWSSEKPILIVCYTNHALDQFLEGIIEFGENNLVRVGGRSNSESLEKFTIRARREEIRKAKETRLEIYNGTRDCREEMKRLRESIERTSATLETTARGILHEKALRDCMTDDQFSSFTPDLGFVGQNKTFMSMWLNFGIETYGKFGDGFGHSDWFALRPDYIEAFLVKLSMRMDQNRFEVEGYLQTMSQDLTDRLEHMHRTLNTSMGYNYDQIAVHPYRRSTEDRWNVYRAMLSRAMMRLDGDLKAVQRSMKRIENKVGKRDKRNRRIDLDPRTQQQLDALKYDEATLVHTLSIISREGILLTSRVVEYMTPVERHILELEKNPTDEFLIARWLGFGFVVDLLVGDLESGTGVDDQADENEFVDAEEEAEMIVNMRKLEEEDTTPSVHAQQMYRKCVSEIAKENLAVQLGSSPQVQSIDDQWQTVRPSKRKERHRVNQIMHNTEQMNEDEAMSVMNVWHLEQHDRCRLYRYWLSVYRDRLKDSIKRYSVEYNRVARRLKMVREDEDYHIMKKATVIGITTTGAAKFRRILQRVQAPIIVVEEAAEVLEAHIISSLNPSCQHLILIGDHKQLRPSPAVYDLAKRFNLDLSLFERMVNNGIQCDTLELQHRMRPEIADLLYFIYPHLKNHETVMNHEHVKGISTDIFFVDHKQEEEKHEENQSHSNAHEASFISALCRYLLLQGYSPSQITILTAYSGQVFQLKNVMPKKTFQGVKITAIDNYQGEENDIILLSLVRSNLKGSIGFLGIENRVCVALSRARKGLFVVGNFSLLSDRSQMWSNLVQILKSNNQCGSALELYCQNHPATERIKVSTSQDFAASPEGGCKRPCSARLQCGHQCGKPCHILDPDHTDYKCQKKCVRKCKAGHPCKKLCYQKCGDCIVMVKKTIPQCGHIQDVYCHVDPKEAVCQAECNKYLSCGHRCARRCGQSHTTDCRVKVKKTWPCGHSNETYCYTDPEYTPCSRPCQTMLDCGHPCSGSCGECLQGRIHKGCIQKCARTLVCGHECLQPCTKSCPPCTKPCENQCVHSSCENTCGEACFSCTEPCTWRCEHYQCTKLCSEPCDRPPCNKPCKRRLPCGHRCIGLCGEECPKLCRICNKDEVCEILFGNEDEKDARFILLKDCGHVIEVSGMDQWMASASADDNAKTDVQLKGCPKCKVPIRKSLRYGNLVKRSLQDIENVKQKVRGDPQFIRLEMERLETQLHKESHLLDDEVYEHLTRRLDMKRQTQHELNLTENKISLLQRIGDFQRKLNKEKKSGALSPEDVVEIEEDIKEIKTRIMSITDYVSNQQLDDFKQEILRLRYLFQMKTAQKKLPSDVPPELKTRVADAIKELERRTRFTSDMTEKMSKLVEILKKKVPLGISKEEKEMIVKAMGLSQGHWFKCPKGHVYAIGDCGGAMEESTCPECKAVIGGTQHKLREGNQVASEMDGARYAAWSEQANLHNYEHL